jgi:predicted phosphodiesterase
MFANRVAALFDIHGNLPALVAVLEEVRREEVEQIVVGGDVFPGPMPRETLGCLLDLDIPFTFILGNGDREVLAQMAGTETDWYRAAPEPWREPVRWTAQQLDAGHAKLLASWPATYRLDIRGLGDVLFCHATPRNDTDIFTRLTSEEALSPLFVEVDASLVVCGHTHMPFDRMVGRVRVVNAGSVGMPFGEPGADWLLLGPGVELRHTPYDFAKASERVRATSYPKAGDFAENHILSPPSEEKMLDLFSKATLK